MRACRGMGWTEGRSIGRNAKEEVQAKELVRRPQRLGLGAAPAPPEKKEKKYIKPGGWVGGSVGLGGVGWWLAWVGWVGLAWLG